MNASASETPTPSGEIAKLTEELNAGLREGAHLLGRMRALAERLGLSAREIATGLPYPPPPEVPGDLADLRFSVAELRRLNIQFQDALVDLETL